MPDQVVLECAGYTLLCTSRARMGGNSTFI